MWWEEKDYQHIPTINPFESDEFDDMLSVAHNLNLAQDEDYEGSYVVEEEEDVPKLSPIGLRGDEPIPVDQWDDVFVAIDGTREKEDVVNHPDHYTQNKMECIDAIEGLNLPFHEAQILKYIVRWEHKNGVEDLKKARWYLQRLIVLQETE